MSDNYPSDYPRSRKEAIAALRTVRDEDIDFSDIPATTDEELKRFRRGGDYVREVGRRNLAALTRIMCGKGGSDSAAAEALIAHTPSSRPPEDVPAEYGNVSI